MNDKLQVSANQERHPTIDNATNPPQPKRKLFPSTLHLLTSIYGLLYLMFFIASFFPSTIGLVSESNNPYDLENLIIKLLFVVFLVGYFISWKREGVAGLIFVLWWVADEFSVTPHCDRGYRNGIPSLDPSDTVHCLLVQQEKGKSSLCLFRGHTSQTNRRITGVLTTLALSEKAKEEQGIGYNQKCSLHVVPPGGQWMLIKRWSGTA
jgi:lysylphosphatidylglycerol synthetase-like protein (DUF2156 family)